MTIKSITTLLFLFIININCNAGAPMYEFTKNIDWEFMGDKTRFSLDLCKCEITKGGNGSGFKVTIAEPIAMVENTSTPWNVVALGKKFDKSVGRKQAASRNGGNNKRYTHFITFPVMALMNFVQDYICFERVSFTSFLYWSEVIPSQNNGLVALYTELAKGPISKAWYNNIFGTLACSVDCAATTFNYPLNSLHWCAGCAGSTGNGTAYGNGKDSDPIMEAHVNAYTALDSLHTIGSLSKVSNATYAFSPVALLPNSMCKPRYFSLAPKTQYYFQLVKPTVWDATTIGKFAPLHAMFKNKPNSEDDVAMWVWTIKQTCAGGAKCKSMFTRITNN